MPEAQDQSTAQDLTTVQGEDILLLAALFVVAPISSALIMWGILPYMMGWIFPMISL